MNDMSTAIIPKSDQLNADDLLAGPITIKITGVSIKGGQEQPVAISYEGDNGKPYKACKSMCRVMVSAWGADASKYVGRSMTLYCDPKVRWAGMEVGGIRISHMSHIDSSMTMALTVTRGNKKPFIVKPLTTTAASAQESATITADQATELEAMCTENGISVDVFKEKAGVDRIAQIVATDYPKAKKWLEAQIAKKNATTAV